MSSMLRKGTKQFKPSARPRPPASRPSSSQPSTRPSIESQSQTPTTATQPSNSIPSIVENVVREESSQTPIPQPAKATPPGVLTPETQSQTPTTTQSDQPSEASSSAKRKAAASEIGDPDQSEQPPSKARKLTPPSDLANDLPITSTTTAPSHNQSRHPQPTPRLESPAVSHEQPNGNNNTSARPSIPEGGSKGHGSIEVQTSQPSARATSAIPRQTSTADERRDELDVSPVERAREVNDMHNSRTQQNPEASELNFTGAPNTIRNQQTSNLPAARTVESEDADLSGMGAGEASQISQVVTTATPMPSETPTPIDERAASSSKKTKKKAAPRKKKVQAEDGDEVRATVEVQLNKPRHAAGQRRARKKKDGQSAKSKKKRAETPEGAEDDEVDHTTMKMSDLCKDIRIGKKFSKHDEIKQRHNRKKVRDQLEKDHPELLELVDNADKEGGTEGRDEPIDEPAPAANSNGVQMRVVDGQIVIDERSLQVDRHRQAQDEGVVMEEIEENDFSKATNSGAYMKRVATIRWDGPANELFYQGLRQFGTAFEMIAAMFPGRNRRQIKLKFIKEERENPHKVDRALTGQTEEIDFDEYTTLTGQAYEEVADIEAETRRIDEEHRAEEAAIETAKAATIQKKKDAISNAARRVLNSVGDEDGPESQKENAVATTSKGKKKAKPKKKNLASSNGGGEEIEILGTV